MEEQTPQAKPEPGRELDEQVARILGDTRDGWTWTSTDGSRFTHVDGGPRRYSTEIESAWRVVKWLEAKGYGVRFVTWPDAGQASLIVKEGPEAYTITVAAVGDTAMHAVCMVALQESGVDVPGAIDYSRRAE